MNRQELMTNYLFECLGQGIDSEALAKALAKVSQEAMGEENGKKFALGVANGLLRKGLERMKDLTEDLKDA